MAEPPATAMAANVGSTSSAQVPSIETYDMIQLFPSFYIYSNGVIPQLRQNIRASPPLCKEERKPRLSDPGTEALVSSDFYRNNFGPYILDGGYNVYKYQQEMKTEALALGATKIIPPPVKRVAPSKSSTDTTIANPPGAIPKSLDALPTDIEDALEELSYIFQRRYITAPTSVQDACDNTVTFGRMLCEQGACTREFVLMSDCVKRTAKLDGPKDLVLQYPSISKAKIFVFEIVWPGRPEKARTCEISTSVVMTRTELARIVAKEFQEMENILYASDIKLGAAHSQNWAAVVYFSDLWMSEMRQGTDGVWRAVIDIIISN